MRQYILAAAFGLAVAGTAAASPLTFTATVGGIATGANLNFLTFDGADASATVTLGLSNAQIVTGSVTDLYAMPYFSSSNGAFFGESPANGQDTTPYVSVEEGGTATFAFTTDQSYFGLLWGSVDTYNALSFYDKNGDLVGIIGGADVTASANGDQGSNGTYYVNVLSGEAFTTVVASSSSNAFEFDDVAYDPPPSGIAEPGTLALFGAALAGFGGLRRHKRKPA